MRNGQMKDLIDVINQKYGNGRVLENPSSMNTGPVLPVPLPNCHVGGAVEWKSPIFGTLSGDPVIEVGEGTFTLVHPLTGRNVLIPKEWLVEGEKNGISSRSPS